jgi:hypothetical protein
MERDAVMPKSFAMIFLLLAAPLWLCPRAWTATTNTGPVVILAVGAPGSPEFATNFIRQAELWSAVCLRAQARLTQIGLDSGGSTTDRDRIRAALTSEAQTSDQALWVVFIGHGTFDGTEARFNLRGPDVSASDLAEWLAPVRRPVVFIDTTSASAPLLNELSKTNRVIITATRSGNEQNFSRFGLFFAEALADPGSDLDKDGQSSALEVFLAASARVAEFYKTEGRLATEHALLDDNGDALGTPADWFRGIRAIKKPEGQAAVDGVHAHQFHLVLSPQEQLLPAETRAKRDAIELEIARLRDAKARFAEADYYRKLEDLLNRLVDLYGKQL